MLRCRITISPLVRETREISNPTTATGGMPSTPRNLGEESSNRGPCASDLQKRCLNHQALVGTLRCRRMIGPEQRNALALVHVILYKYAPINATTFLIYGCHCFGSARSYFSPMYLSVVPADSKTETRSRVCVLRYITRGSKATIYRGQIYLNKFE